MVAHKKGELLKQGYTITRVLHVVGLDPEGVVCHEQPGKG